MEKEVLPSLVGYGVFGVLAIIAIIYIVKFSIEIDKENYKKQMMNNPKYQPTRKPSSPQFNSIRLSSGEERNTSFTSLPDYGRQYPYMTSNNNANTSQYVPQRKPTLPSSSPNSMNQFNTIVPSSSYQPSVSYSNRQSRQYLLQNFQNI